mmetsp:Transcript_23024/g.42404  ORF Transcript_23024/g.42404 Transcript_23024/m.42404 type:complete len:434 (+) Transcript_23024:83-1384(+)
MGMVRNRNVALALALVAVASDYIGVSMMRITLPFYSKAMGGASTMVGGLETAYGVGQAVGALALPRLSDSFGRRRILTACCACATVGYCTAMAAKAISSPTLLLASRFPVGLAKQTVTVSRAIVADVSDASGDRSRWMSYLCAALAAGCTLGPLLGSTLAYLLGKSAPVMFNAVLFAILGPVVATLLPETSPGGKYAQVEETFNGDEKKGTHSKKPLWRSGIVVTILAVLAPPELGLVAHQGAVLVAYCMNHLGKNQVWIANLTSLSAVVQTLSAATFLTWLTRRGWSDIAILQLGSVLFAVCALSIWSWQSPQAVMLSAPCAAAANAVLRSYPASLLSKQVDEDQQGEAMGLLDICSSVWRVVAPVLAGVMLDQYGAESVFAGEAALFVLGIIGLGVLPRVLPTPTAADINVLKKEKKVHIEMRENLTSDLD